MDRWGCGGPAGMFRLYKLEFSGLPPILDEYTDTVMSYINFCENSVIPSHTMQVVVPGDVYVAELMVESYSTVDAQTILSILNTTTSLHVNSAQGADSTVTLLQYVLVADCLIDGNVSSCNCSTGYTWSNDVCYNYSCCTETTCTANVSHITLLCVHKVNVQISGSVKLSSGTWDTNKNAQLQNALQGLNGLQYLNITNSGTGADFQAAVSVRMRTKKLQDIVNTLQTNLPATVWVNTSGMVTIVSPNTTVCYESSQVLTCIFEEATDSAGWNMTYNGQNFELNNGTVVQLNNCITPEYDSCTALTLKKVTSDWAGMYECGFITESVRHTARTHLSVAVLPDVITIVTSPLTADCSQQQTGSVNINISTTIPQSTENYEVWWSYNGTGKNPLYNTSYNDSLVYKFTANISCQKTSDAQYINVTFKNMEGQKVTAQVDIPVIYEDSTICSEDVTDGDLWPKTPAGATVIINKCPGDRFGYKSRTCIGPAWQPVFNYCFNQQLKTLLKEADDFLKGRGASQKTAMNIFQGLTNIPNSEHSDNFADVSASINVLTLIQSASNDFDLHEEVLPNFINAASNIVNNTWNTVNDSILHNMSSAYLQSVEGLVKNINVNMSKGVKSPNLELKFCSTTECSVSVFDIHVDIKKTNGAFKTVAVKNLMDKLKNDYSNMRPTGLLLSATLEDNNDSSVEIRLEFPNDQLNNTKALCVFWNTTAGMWSDVGCNVTTSDKNHTLCECNHLTSFSVLMSKGEVPASSIVLDIITNVGLGVSVCCLLIFLIIESLVWSAVVKTNLSHFRHTAMVNIAVFLLLADVSFLASTSPDILSETWCLVLTVCKHLFYLAMFCWMLCLSVVLVHQLMFVFSPLRKKVFIVFSSFVGYVCPVLIVGSSYVYTYYTNRPYYDKKTCWLVFERLMEGSIHAFLLPVGTVILTNLFFMMVVILTLVKSSIPDNNKADDKGTAKSILKVVVFLTPVFGVTWIFGLIQLMLKPDHPLYDAVEFCFTVLNSFQGVFIFLMGCFAEQKVREGMVKIIMAKSQGTSYTKKNLTSATYTKDK
ncbi:adhesion G-protein coupled receptor F3-like [Anabas testudineus]|uniref:adhesion G-protein coupled receptor F3-like n=1 Tax=Anabas testudineus TaxID=64144 RepID=UPI000E46192E|nr:adhesion G-protein coupled receptor F3-like [Anabas testudineus]